VRRTVEIEGRIDELLAGGIAGDDLQGALSELAALGAWLIIQRAVEEEFDTWLGRARYERRPEAPPGKRNGYRPAAVARAESRGSARVASTRKCRAAYSGPR
jgi:hypothetical protein